MTFVGRTRELDEISKRLNEAVEGRGNLVLLVGEPGIGKTRLADAITTRATSTGFRIGWGRAWESGGAPAYYPWAQVFDALQLRMPDASTSTAVDSEAARFQLFRGAVQELRHASAEAPRLIVLDDLHVADTSSLLLLLFVARELRTMRLVILGTYRDVEVRLSAPMADLLAKIAKEGTAFHLGRLERADVEELVRSSGDAVSSEVEESIWRSTQGNPLFVQEILRLLAAEPELARGSALPIPHGVREVIRQRLGLLDDASVRLLDVASVIGVEFERAVLSATARVNETGVASTIAHARKVGVLVDAGGGRERFGHALIREAIYNDLPASRRVELHAAVADALDRSHPDDPPLSEVAHHTILAGPTAADRLVDRSIRAAHAFSDAYAHEDAVKLLERADAALIGMAEDHRRICDLWLALGYARMHAGDVAGGTDAFLRAAARARALGDAPLLARAALGYGSEFTVGSTDPTLKVLLEEALGRLGGDHRELRVRLEARLAASLQPGPDPEAIAAMAHRAIDEARQLGDDETFLEVLHTASAALGDAVLVPDGEALQMDAVRLAIRLGDRAKLLRAYIRLIFYLMEKGDVRSADAYIDAFETAARATGQPRYIWPAPFLRAMRATMEGRFADAETLTAEARAIIATVPDPVLSHILILQRFHRLRAEERTADLIAMEPEFLAACAGWNAGEDYSRAFRASVRAAAGDLTTARDELARVSFDSVPGRIRVSFGMIALAALECGDVDRASAFYERLLASEGLWFIFGWGGFAVDSTYARLLGGFASMLGRFDAAERHFDRALAMAERVGARPERCRISIDFGQMLLARGAAGDVPRATELFERARPICSELNLARSLARLPASIVARGPASRPPALRDDRAWSVALTAEADTWTVQAGTSLVRLKDSRGLQYLARLVAEPGRAMHALDLAGGSGDVELGDAGEALDPEARAAYKRRLAELDEDVREAEAAQDRARLTRARAEIEFLSAELSRAFGLGGKSRRVGSAAERARVAVTRRIREAIRRIGEHAPELGRHLERSVKTGNFCSYDPV